MKKGFGNTKVLTVILFALTVAGLGCLNGQEDRSSRRPAEVIRAGHFPDIGHSAAMVGKVKGTFGEVLGKDTRIDWKIFNAGPSAIEALFSGDIDIAYVGPNPAVNGYIKSGGEALKIVCGAASGGAGLVVRKDAGIDSIEDLTGKTIATPQLANTQDVACRAWLNEHGLQVAEKGGSVRVVPIANPDQLTLFLKKEIDAAWTKEPWVARLIKEGNGKLFLDEREIWPRGEFVTANIIVRNEFLKQNPDLVEKWIKAHVQSTEWINNNPTQARKLVNAEIEKITGKRLPEDVLAEAFSRTTLTYDPIRSSLITSLDWAFEAGFLGQKKPDVSGIYDLSILNKVLKKENLQPVN